MLGVEMMISSMVGMKPEEMKDAAQKTMRAISAVANDMAEIKASQVRIEEMLTTLLEAKGIERNGTRKRIAGNIGNDSEHIQL